MLKLKVIVGVAVGLVVLTCCGCGGQFGGTPQDSSMPVQSDPLKDDASHGKIPGLNPGLSVHVEQRGCLILMVKPRPDVVYPILRVGPP